MSNLSELVISDSSLPRTLLSEHFNNHFVSLWSQFRCDSLFDLVNRSVQETLFLTPTTQQVVFNIFMSLINSKSCDINHLQIKPVKFVIDIIASCLVHTFNLVMLLGKFLSQMKLAKVCTF